MQAMRLGLVMLVRGRNDSVTEVISALLIHPTQAPWAQNSRDEPASCRSHDTVNTYPGCNLRLR